MKDLKNSYKLTHTLETAKEAKQIIMLLLGEDGKELIRLWDNLIIRSN